MCPRVPLGVSRLPQCSPGLPQVCLGSCKVPLFAPKIPTGEVASSKAMFGTRGQYEALRGNVEIW